MNEVKIVFSDAEVVANLRELGATVEERRVTRWSGEESFQAWVWQVQKGNGEWMDAISVFRELATLSLRRSVTGNVNTLDLLNLIK